MDEIEEPIGPILTFLLFASIYYLIRRGSGSYFINKGLLEIFVVAFLIVSGSSIVWISRYYMPHLTLNNFSGSILGRPIVLKDKDGFEWAVYNTGESLNPVHLKGKLMTVVVPWRQINLTGQNHVGKTFVRLAPLSFLPPVVHTFLINNKEDYNLDKIKFGRNSEEFRHKNFEIEDYEAEMDTLHSQINLRNDLLQGRNEIFEEQLEFAKKMSSGKRSIFDVFRRPKPESEE